MYNKQIIDHLIQVVTQYNGINDKEKLITILKAEFELVQDRKVFVCPDFAIRFSKSERKKMSNTVISLSAIKKYDDRPFFVCIVASTTNYLLLANSTFLKKVSHSSQNLREDNIRGSINGSDIIFQFQSIDNSPENFQQLYAYHQGLSFQDNLERLVENTNDIVGRIDKFVIDTECRNSILSSVNRAHAFVSSKEYSDLNNDLNNRVKDIQDEIANATLIDNVNLRGRIIEYLITDNGSELKDQIITALRNHDTLPIFKTEDRLGDYSKRYPSYVTETDIKTKVLSLESNPKAYNIDKLLEFLSQEKTVYMIYILGIDESGSYVARLCSVFDKRLINATNIIQHWAGRNSRGVAQFNGKTLASILDQNILPCIDDKVAYRFLNSLIER